MSSKRRITPGRNSAARTKWFRQYRSRMKNGYEYCRQCGSKENLTFGHLLPASLGGRFSPKNLTIQCVSCNQATYDYVLLLIPLAAESDFEEISKFESCTIDYY